MSGSLILSSEKTADLKPDDIAVVTLDIKKIAAGYDRYKKLSAKKKIQRIQKVILESYDKLKKSKDIKLIIFVWREYGISDPDKQSISSADKSFLKYTLCEMTRNKDDLLIIAGPTLIRKKIKDPGETKRNLISYYKARQWMNEKQDQEQQAQELKKISTLDSKKNILITKFGFSSLKKYKTSMFIAYNGNIVARIGKAAIYNEAKESNKDQGIVQPAKGRNLPRVFQFKNLILGFDICRDHANGVLKKYSNDHGISVDIQFVLSDSYTLRLDNLCAKLGCIYVDSLHNLSFVTPADLKAQPFQLYGVNVLSPSTPKLVSINSIYPMQYCCYYLIPQFINILNHFKDPQIIKLISLLNDLAEGLATGTMSEKSLATIFEQNKLLHKSKNLKISHLSVSMNELLGNSLRYCLSLQKPDKHSYDLFFKEKEDKALGVTNLDILNIIQTSADETMLIEKLKNIMDENKINVDTPLDQNKSILEMLLESQKMRVHQALIKKGNLSSRK